MLAFLAGVIGFCSSWLYLQAASLWQPGQTQEAILLIERGDSLRDLHEKIQATDRPASWPAFQAYARWTGADRKIKAGRYRIPGDWSAVQILEQSTLGANDTQRVTLPPGLALPEIAARLESAGWVESATAWIELASGPAALLSVRRPNYEGLVAPETYFFDAAEPPEKVLAKLHDEWKRKTEEVARTAILDEPMANGLTLYDSIVLASVIEKEAAREVDRATASSVFHNRIRKGWPLGSAATLRYAIGDWTGSDRKLPINLDSPYNTSRKPGLPPTPICLPSRESLRAALSPPETEYFFFVADGTGGLRFNKTFDEHRLSVRDYRNKMEPAN